jgi:hypothetical protein
MPIKFNKFKERALLKLERTIKSTKKRKWGGKGRGYLVRGAF